MKKNASGKDSRLRQNIALRLVQMGQHFNNRLSLETKTTVNCCNLHLLRKANCGALINAGGVPTTPDSRWTPRMATGHVVLMTMTTRLMQRVMASALA